MSLRAFGLRLLLLALCAVAAHAQQTPGRPTRRSGMGARACEDRAGSRLAPDLLDAARRLGVVVVQNPVHLRGSRALQTEVYDSAALANLAPLRSLIDRGIPLALGADENGDGTSPFLNNMRATTHPTNPKEALTREQAVIAYTRGSAFAEMAEREKGTLAPGMLADLVVLSQHIFAVPTEALPATHSVLTIIGGRIAYDELTMPNVSPPGSR